MASVLSSTRLAEVRVPTLDQPFDRRFFILGLFLLLFALGTMEGPRGDAYPRFVLTQQILAYGRVHIPELSNPWGFLKTPSGWTTFSPIGQTLLFIPFETAGKAFEVLFPGSSFRPIPIRYFYCPVVGVAYFLALMGLLEALGLSSRAAAIASLSFTFSSLIFYYLAMSYQEEAPASVLVCLAVRAAVLWRKHHKIEYAFQAGLFGSSLFLFRMNGAAALIPVALFFAQGLYALGLRSIGARKAIGAALFGALSPAAVHMILAYLRFGNPLSTGYDQVVSSFLYRPPISETLQSVLNLLVGPGKGLFLYSPLLLIAFWVLWTKWEKVGLYGVGCLLALAASVLISVKVLFDWDGCWSWGARYQVHLLPLFAYPAWLGIADLWERGAGRVIVVTMLGFGLFAQLCSMMGTDRLEHIQLVNAGTAEPCPIVRANQFVMRLGNISSVIRTEVTGRGLNDRVLVDEFAPFWGVRLARRGSGWSRTAVTLAWLALFPLAAACLHRALLHTKPGLD